MSQTIDMDTVISLDERRSRRDANSVDCTVGRNLRHLRTERAVTLEALALHLRVSSQQVLKYEQGVDRMGASTLYEIAKLFDVTASRFYEGLPDAGDAKQSDEEEALAAFVQSEEGQVLCTAYRRVSRAKQRRSILALVRMLSLTP
jgi:transcriptional regulator with XRE-family HTH domain